MAGQGAGRSRVRQHPFPGGIAPAGDGLFHCQQAAEKALKGWLTFHEIPFLKTHDLAVLLNLCAAKEKGFQQWQESLPRLTPFATESRYPGDALEPAAEDIREAEKLAREVVEFVFRKIGSN